MDINYGIKIARKGGMTLGESLKRMVNPNSVAILSGFILFLLRINIPEFFMDVRPHQYEGANNH